MNRIGPKDVAHTLRYIFGHPLNRKHPAATLGRVLRWQIGSRLMPGAVAVPFVDDTRLLVKRGMTGATGNVYCGLHEFEDMALVLHALRPGDVFVDAGANVGAYTVLAAGGAGSHVVAAEPVATTFARLLDNIRINNLTSLVEPHQVALGATVGVTEFSLTLDTVNHIVTEAEASTQRQTIPISTLDTLLGGRSPALMKIDVEGYETPVIAGAQHALHSPNLLGIIMEFNGSGRRYGYDEAALRRTMLEMGFEPFQYEPYTRSLHRANGVDSANTLYVRNIEKLAERVKSAPKHFVRGVAL